MMAEEENIVYEKNPQKSTKICLNPYKSKTFQKSTEIQKNLKNPSQSRKSEKVSENPFGILNPRNPKSGVSPCILILCDGKT